jgi:hypothetical protein
MNPTSLLSRIRDILDDNAGVVLLGIVLGCAQTLIPVDWLLADASLTPWMMQCLALAVFLRARAHGDGPHPMLVARSAGFLSALQRIAVTAIPAVILAFWLSAGAFYEGVFDNHAGRLEFAVASGTGGLLGTALILGLLGVSTDNGRTAWAPPGRPSSQLIWGSGIALSLALCVLLGMAGAINPQGVFQFLPQAFLLGLGFLISGFALGRVQHLHQRRAAGLRDGSAYWPSLFRPTLAFLGPSLGLWILLQLYVALTGAVGFGQAWVVVFHVLSWAVILWPKPTPVAVHCLLHEVVPVGGADERPKESASSFEEAPEGALRINPLDLRRTRTVHAWTIPVRACRIEELDDPIRPLWARPAPIQPFHMLGEAAFEPTPGSLRVQTQELSIQLRGTSDVASMGSGALARRVVVLQAFPEPGQSRTRRPATYRWETAVPAVCVQVVDAATQRIFLRNGSLLVLSTEGIARAYELEVGAAVYDWEVAMLQRPPQLEDYVG